MRLRLTLLYGALFLVAGTLLLAITYELVSSSVSADVKGLVTLPVDAMKGGSQLVSNPGAHGVLYLSSHSAVGPVRTGVVAARPDARLVPPGFARLQRLANGLRAQAKFQIQEQRSNVLGALLTRSGVALGIMALVSIGLGWLMAGRALRPVRTMSARARMITERNLHERLAVEGPADELRELGDTFDGLLSRLERAFESQRRFVANASHELRTPITVQRTLVEVALGDPDASEESLRAVCERVIAVGEQQERLIESLLTLARSQRGLETKGPVDLDQIVTDALQQGAQAGDVRVEATLEPAPTTGDAGLVERLVTNLVDNAYRHNRPDGWIRVSTGLRGGRASLELSNAGPPIAPDEVQPLFEPFRRRAGQRTVDPARSPARQGLGLGLSIVRAIADAHGAELSASAGDQGGLRVRVSFPGAVLELGEPSRITEPVAGEVRLTA